MHITPNKSKTYIDDVSGKSCSFMLVPVYDDGGYHLNIHGASNLDEAKEFAQNIQEDYNEIKIHSINEGHYN